MFSIPGPPLPQWSDLVAYGVSGACVLVALLILLWGRNLGRALLVVLAAGLGFALSAPIAERFELQLALVRPIAILAPALGALLLARLIWALMAGALAGIVAECIVFAQMINNIPADKQPSFAPTSSTLIAWGQELAVYFGRLFLLLATERTGLFLAAVTPPIALIVVILLARDRLARIIMTALLGSAGVVFGPILAVCQFRPSLWDAIWTHWYVPAAIALVFMIASVVRQYLRALKEEKAIAQRQADAKAKIAEAAAEPSGGSRKK